jgi:outer membrane protein OmpA-like peptidoglycan-associated protein
MRGRLFWIVSVALAASGARAEEAPSDAIARVLDGLAGGWSEAGLEVRAGGADGTVRVGEPVALEIAAAQEARVVVIHVDSHGVGNVLAPSTLARTARISPQEPLRLETLGAAPPVGRDRIWVVATRRPLDLARLGLAGAESQVLRLARENALDLATRLRDALSDLPRGDVAVGSASYRVIGRGEIQYTVGDVVAQLSPTRSIPRPRLDLQEVRFAFDSAELTPQAIANLDVVGEALTGSDLAEEKFRLGGHTDDVGTDSYNLGLSQRRAEAARRYLIERWKIAPERIEVVGYGESRPLESSESEEARALNRRVDLEVNR